MTWCHSTSPASATSHLVGCGEGLAVRCLGLSTLPARGCGWRPNALRSRSRRIPLDPLYHSGARGPLPSGMGVNSPPLFLCSNTRALLPVGARALTPCGVACGPEHVAHPVACARRSAGQAASGSNRRGTLPSHVGWPSIRTPARSGGHPARRSASCRSAEKPLAFAMGSVTVPSREEARADPSAAQARGRSYLPLERLPLERLAKQLWRKMRWVGARA